MKTKSQVFRLFNALSACNPLSFPEQKASEDYPAILPPLLRAGLIKQDSPGMEVVLDCPNHCLVTAFELHGRYYASCSCEEAAPPQEIDPAALKRLRFDLPAFLDWLISAVGIEADLEEEEPSGLWYLGEKTLRGETAPVYFSRLRDAEQVSRLQKGLHKQGNLPIVFWLGETPRRGQFPATIISIPESITFLGNDPALDAKRIEALFTKRLITVSAGDIILDHDIALRKLRGKCFLLFGQEIKNQFGEEVPILPQAYKIIRHLFQIRKYGNNAESPAELCKRGFAINRSTISNRIAEIRKICRDHNATAILHQFPRDKWGLNPVLSCCNTSRR